HMKGNKSYLTDYEEINGGFVAFIDFKLTDEIHILLKVPRKDNMYSVDLKNVVPQRGLTCLFAKAIPVESNLWPKRLGHVNSKTMNKLVRRSLVKGIENLIDLKVKVIRCDNGTEFKNRVMNQFCEMKGNKREFSVARTSQQNGVAERTNKTLIEAAKTMLANSKLPTTFWAEAVNTACRKLALSFMRPFGCPVIILNTIDHLDKFNGKADEGFFVGYSTNSKAFRVFNSKTRIVEENMHVQFSENTPNIVGSGPNWLFDINALTNYMNYKPDVAGNQSNGNAGTKACNDAGKARIETLAGKDYILLPMWPVDILFSQDSKNSPDTGFKPSVEEEKKDAEDPGNKDSEVQSTKEPRVYQEKDDNVSSTNNVNTASNTINTVSLTVNAAGIEVNVVDPKSSIELPNDLNMPELEDIIYSDDDEDVGTEADMNNLDAFMPVSPILTTRIHKDHPVEQIIRDLNSAPQTRRMTKNLKEHEPKKVIHALKDPSWIEAMQDDLLQFKLQKNKARLVAQGYTQEEGIDNDEVFAPVARIEEIRLFLAYASFKDFVVCQMDVKSAFLYGKIKEEFYVYQPLGFQDPDIPDRVYKVEKALYGLHQASRAWYETLSTYLLDNGFQRGKIDKTLFIRKVKSDILLVQLYVDDIIFGSTKKSLCIEFKKMMHKNQDKYVTEILKKFGFTDVKTASTPMKTHKPLFKDTDGEDVDEHVYRSMIGSMMYLTSSRPDIMFVVCACARYQVNLKVSHLHAVKRIFRYLKCQRKLGPWYPKDSPFDLVAYTDSDFAGASLDRKSTIGGCQFLRCRLISWQCKKQIVVANSTTEAEYITASNCCEQFWDTVKAKTVNGEVQLQALVDKKKVIITESTIRRDLQLEDANGVDCLPNAAIFEHLTLIGMVKFWMYPRFVQVFVNKQVGDMSHHKRIYVTPSHTKKIFGNMKREGKGFSGRVTPLFQTMMVQAHEEMGEGSEIPTDPHHTPIIQPSTSQPQKKQSRRKQRKDTEIPQSSGPTEHIADEVANEENVPTQSNDPPLSRVNTLGSGEDRLSLKELMDLCTKLSDRVLDLETTKTAQAKEIASLKKRVKKLERKRKSKTPGMKRLFKIEVTLIDETQGRNDDNLMFDTGVLDEQEVKVKKVVITAEVTTKSATTTTADELTLAQTLIETKAAKPKVRGVMIQQPSEITTTTTTTPAASKPL
ncbi:putative ribonuclease H-like domain-containing protein, partial [Tanacetum coccineum]